MSRFSKGRFLPGISCLQSDTLLAYRYQFASSLKTCLPISCRRCRIWSFWFVLITLLMAVFLDTWEIGWSAVDPTQKGLHFTNPGWWGVFGNDFLNIWFVCKAFSGWNLKITIFWKGKSSYSKTILFQTSIFNGSMWVFSKFVAALEVEEISLWPPAELESLPGQFLSVWRFVSEPWTFKRETTSSDWKILWTKRGLYAQYKDFLLKVGWLTPI